MERQMRAVFLTGRITMQMAPGVDWQIVAVKASGEEVRFEPEATHAGVAADGRGIWIQPRDKDGHLVPTITVADGEVTVEQHHAEIGDEGWYTERAWMEAYQHYGYCR